jgi:hypothetical protein
VSVSASACCAAAVWHSDVLCVVARQHVGESLTATTVVPVSASDMLRDSLSLVLLIPCVRHRVQLVCLVLHID